jgi:hypothetical protein
MILSLTAWQYDAPVWSGCTGLMECEGGDSLTHVCVQLPEDCSGHDDSVDDDGLWRGIGLTLH